jgi:hypothetical protein
MEQSPVNAIRSDWGRMCDAGKKMSDLGDEACGRVFISHLYGLLLPDERAELLNEAFRVGCEIVILDPGRPSVPMPRNGSYECCRTGPSIRYSGATSISKL